MSSFFRHPLRLVCSVLLTCAACQDTSSPDETVVASVGAHSLTTTSLSVPFGYSDRAASEEELRAATELWIDYQLLARAVATKDTLGDPQIVERAMWGPVANARAQQWYRRVSPTFPAPPLDPKTLYESGQIVTARQILIPVPKLVLPAQGFVIKQKLDSLRATLTPANFARVASRLSADSLSRNDGGQLPAWPPGRDFMIPAFEKAVLDTKPGNISAPVLTDFGAHIIYRPTWTEAQPRVLPAVRELSGFLAESTYFDALFAAQKVQMTPDVASVAREIARAPERYDDSSRVLATIAGGDFTAGMLVRWLRAFPATEGITGQLTNAPDTLVPVVLRRIIRNELFLRQADSAGIVLTRDERSVLDGQLRAMMQAAVGTLSIAEAMLPDSIRKGTNAQRLTFLVARVDRQFASILQGTAAPVPIPSPVRALLRARYSDVVVQDAALTRALDQARRVRQTRDSLRNNSPKDSATGRRDAVLPKA